MDSTITTHILKFKDDVTDMLKEDLKKIKINDSYISDSDAQVELEKLIAWLFATPKNVVFRINTILCEQQVALNQIKDALKRFSRPLPIISTFSDIPELIVVNSWEKSVGPNLERLPNEIIVDIACGAAVLRGAHIYASGVLGMPQGLAIGDKVSVYADFKRACKKGLITKYDNESKLFIGNGIVQLTRKQLFGHEIENISGIAILMTDVISCIPQVNENILPKGYIILQNLPSIICSRILDPQPGETILDMCAAPGNKTTHIAALMQNEGTLIALEKIKNKLEKLITNITNFSVRNAKAFCFDSTKAICETNHKPVLDGPPFSKESFDRILLDGPCSALGQRPQISNFISASQLGSYVPLQRKLFSSAIQLLKPGGILVYSTCTITIAENEGIVAWALKTFPNIHLQSVSEKLINFKMDKYTSVGHNIDGLSIEQSNNLCRFGCVNDSVGFFIACFIKR